MFDCSAQMHRVEMLRDSLEQSVLKVRHHQPEPEPEDNNQEGNNTGAGSNHQLGEKEGARPYYHHHRRRPLIMLFQSSQTAIIQVSGLPQKRPDMGTASSRFSVSPTPNALPASTISPSPFSAGGGVNPAKPLRVIVSNNTIAAAAPPPHQMTTTDGSASSPASSMDSGVALSPSPHDSDQHQHHLHFFTTVSDKDRVMNFNATDHPNPPPPPQQQQPGKFRPRSVSECFAMRRLNAEDPPTPMVECTERRRPWMVVKDDSSNTSPSPIIHTTSGGSNGTLKGILKKTSTTGFGQLKGNNTHHFRRDQTRFMLSRSLSESISALEEEDQQGGGVVVLNNAFNGMVLNNLCEEENEEVDGCEEEEEEGDHRPGCVSLRMKQRRQMVPSSQQAVAVCCGGGGDLSNGSDSSLNTATDDLVETGSCGGGDDDYMMIVSPADPLQLQPRKKRVSFSEHVQARIYRSNSSILGQKRKNEKKVRSKRRRTESESSITTDDGSQQERVKVGHKAGGDNSPNQQRRDSGIGTHLLDDDSDNEHEHASPCNDSNSSSSSNGSPPISPKRIKRLISADSAIELGEEISAGIEHLAVR